MNHLFIIYEELNSSIKLKYITIDNTFSEKAYLYLVLRKFAVRSFPAGKIRPNKLIYKSYIYMQSY